MSIDIDALLDKATPLASRDDAGESLQRIASALPPVVQGVGELRALINSLPAPTPPSLRPARAGDAVGVMAGSATAASGDPNQLATGGVGQTSGSTIAVLPQLFYGRQNLLTDPMLDGGGVGVIGAAFGTETFALPWSAAYVVNSGSPPTDVQGFIDYGVGSLEVLNTNEEALWLRSYPAGGGSTDFLFRSLRDATTPVGAGFPFLLAAVRLAYVDTNIFTNITSVTVWMELANSTGVPIASSPAMDWKAFVAAGTKRVSQRQLVCALPAPSNLTSYVWQLRVRVVSTAAGGDVRVSFGEPQLVFSSVEQPPPFSPIVGAWQPAFVFGRGGNVLQIQSASAVDTQARFSINSSTGMSWGSGTAAFDLNLVRTAAGQLTLTPSSAAVDLVLLLQSAAAKRASVRLQAAADTNLRTVIYGDASEAGIEFGGGAGATDVRFSRPAANIVRIDTPAAGRASLELVAGVGPGTPAAGVGRIYFSSVDKHLHHVDDAGLDTDLAAASAATQVSMSAVSLSGDFVARIKIAADTTYRTTLRLTTGDAGALEFGAGGVAAADVGFVRTAAATIGLTAGGGLATLGGTLDLSGSKLRAPTAAAITLTTTEGYIGWDSTRKQLRVYDASREKGVGDVGWTVVAWPQESPRSIGTYTVAQVLPINGGSIAIPMEVPTHMLLTAIAVRVTAASGTGEWRLYEDRANASATANEIPGANGTLAAQAAAATFASTPTTNPVYLAPGVYWLVIRCTSATTTFSLGTAAQGTITAHGAETQTLAAVLGATLDLVTTWSAANVCPGVRMQGRVLGQAAAF